MNTHEYMRNFLLEFAIVEAKLPQDSGFGHFLWAIRERFGGLDVYSLMKKIHELEYVYSTLRIKKERESLTDDENVLFLKTEGELENLVPEAEQVLRIGYASWLVRHANIAISTAVFNTVRKMYGLSGNKAINPETVSKRTGLRYDGGSLKWEKYGIELNVTPVLDEEVQWSRKQREDILKALHVIPVRTGDYHARASSEEIRDNFFRQWSGHPDIKDNLDKELAKLSPAKRMQVLKRLITGKGMPARWDDLFPPLVENYKLVLNPAKELVERIVNVNLVLHFAHHSGKMGDYIGLSDSQLDEISSLPIKAKTDHRYLRKLSQGTYESRRRR